METFISGVPQTWAFIEGNPFLVTYLEYTSEVETSQASPRQVSVVGQSIEGSGLFFHPNCAPPVFGPNDMPQTLDLEVVAGEQLIAFGDAIFSAMDELPHYEESEAYRLEWVAQEMSHEHRPKELSRNWV